MQPGYGQQGYGAPQGGHQQQPGYPPPQQAAHRPPPVRLNAVLYIIMVVICVAMGGILMFFAQQPATKEALPAVPLPFLVLFIFELIFIFKMYKALNDGVTSPKPGLAVGLMFIPLFGGIWFLICWGKFPGQYNQFIQRHGIRAQPLGSGVYVAGIILAILIPIVGLPLLMGKTAGAVNALSR
jgi:hypothetical protein